MKAPLFILDGFASTQPYQLNKGAAIKYVLIISYSFIVRQYILKSRCIFMNLDFLLGLNDSIPGFN